MRNPFGLGAGGVVSADVAVPEHEREVAFYTSVLTTGATPLWRDDLMNNRGTPVIGLGPRAPEYEHIPHQWMPHVQVADVGASAARALELGGQELMHAKGEDGASQWAVLVDPAGAAFGVVPVVDESAYDVPADELAGMGHIAWLTLVVPDVAAISAFYEAVIGWTPSDGADGARELHRGGDTAAAAILPATGEHAAVPPVWILGLPVGDLAESLQRVRAGGGEVLAGSAEAGHAFVRDPVGVCIGLGAGSC